MGTHDRNPFHEGELELQELAGVREQSARLARAIRGEILDQHRELFERLPLVLIGSVDHTGQPHASALAGPPGFSSVPDPHHLRVATLPGVNDPLAAALRPGASLGVLAIEAHTRRRNRLNGIVNEVSDSGFTIAAQQSFGNCPKYIQARRATWDGPAAAAEPAPAQRFSRLDLPAVDLIAGADTFYLASSYASTTLPDGDASHGVDVSHRGGKPGFVRVEQSAGGDVLTVPDFSGNGLFNTLGNLQRHPRAGLLFIDYTRGDLLHVSAVAEILWDGPELDAFAGAERMLQLLVTSALRVPAALPLRWSEPEPSPFLLDTGEHSARRAS